MVTKYNFRAILCNVMLYKMVHGYVIKRYLFLYYNSVITFMSTRGS